MVNPGHDYPNALLFANSDKHCGFPELLGVLTGNFCAEGGEPIYKNYSEGRIRQQKLSADLYGWFNEYNVDMQKGSYVFIDGEKHYGRLCNLTGSDPLKHPRG